MLKSNSKKFKMWVKKIDDILKSVPKTDYEGQDIRNCPEFDIYVSRLYDCNIDTVQATDLIHDELEARQDLEDIFK